ncbi:hypothetical protein, partial [Corynebacterium sp. HMSC075D04]|uniref:hypothetical protein n=1 Tax=Corynebacterium sp. HMSC075D04 TaxID=1739540 RepID=UPI001AEF85B6
SKRYTTLRDATVCPAKEAATSCYAGLSSGSENAVFENHTAHDAHFQQPDWRPLFTITLLEYSR